ncbi:MAG: hypothetical protein ABIO36_02870 [Pyrinomonadaceae bacterium]
MEPKKVVFMFFAALPALMFCFFYFAPPPAEGGEDWMKFLLLLFSTGLSLLALTVSLFFAVRAKTNMGWWVISALSLTPIISFFMH